MIVATQNEKKCHFLFFSPCIDSIAIDYGHFWIWIYLFIKKKLKKILTSNLAIFSDFLIAMTLKPSKELMRRFLKAIWTKTYSHMF